MERGSGWLQQPLMRWGNWYFPGIWQYQETGGGESPERDLVGRAVLQGLVWVRAARAPFQCGQVQLDGLISMSDQLFGLPEAWAGADRV